MISFDEAKMIALNSIGTDCALINEETIEKPYGWYFIYQSKKFIETGHISDMLIGSGGFIVEKNTGKIIEFGSTYSLEENFEIYEKGFLRRNLDLVITKTFDLNESVRLLNRLQMTYFEPKIEDGIDWKIKKIYNEKQIKIAISNLPCTFQNQNFYFRYEEFQKIDNSKSFEYKLVEHRK